MPGFTPLAMPAQSLPGKFSRRDRRAWVDPRLAATILARLRAVFGGAVALTACAPTEIAKVVGVGTTTALEWVLVVLFVVTFSWLALSFTSSVVGSIWLLTRREGPDLSASLAERTAIVMPIYNEAPSARLWRDAGDPRGRRTHGLGATFDFFFLSDTTDANVWIAKEAAFVAMRERLPEARVYRRRRKNSSREAGNIADFVTHRTEHYPHMLVLDADSVMSGDAIVRLAAVDGGGPDAGIIESLPLIVNRNTMFARLQQFAARIAGPVIAGGLTAWMGRDGNYWGHNAIIRTRAFADHCGLPDLPGKPPLGGHILSHDFVEAALMRRAGYAVYMLPTLGGSYEESPPSLIDLARARPAMVPGQSPAFAHHRRQGVRLGDAPAFRNRDHGLSRFARMDGAAPGRHRAGAAVALHSARILYRRLFAVSRLAAVRLRTRAAIVRTDDRHPARAEVPRPHRGPIRRAHPPGLGRRAGPHSLDLRRDRHLGRDRADHDADPVRFGRADPLRTGHRLESATARRRVDSVRQHRANVIGRMRFWASSRCSPLC